jgi:deoxyribodipyrimidine photo-lyase
MYSRSLFLFRRDLRLVDNTALIEAGKQSKEVISAFVIDPRQAASHAYRSESGVHFLYTSLLELNRDLQEKQSHLFVWNGEVEKILHTIITETGIEAVFVNSDYTPFSRARDIAIEVLCKKMGIAFHSYHDVLLHAPGTVLKDDGKPYTVYTPFMRKSRTIPVQSPIRKSTISFSKDTFNSESSLDVLEKLLPRAFLEPRVKGGRKEGLQLLKQTTHLTDYTNTRNIPAISGTSLLSAHHKFGTISVRESYDQIANALGVSHTLINELYWRDFFTHIAFFFPEVFGKSFHKKYDRISWSKNQRYLEAWKTGMTGFPIVDAGMRELNATGYMHNRARMITASFLVKDLHIDWREGEKYFAQKLVDYDPAVNNGNWQWAASTGCDAQPYFRIFNPWLQQKTYDPDCVYIKKWVKELNNLSVKEIHDWYKEKTLLTETSYPLPMVQHALESAKAKQVYKKALTGE